MAESSRGKPDNTNPDNSALEARVASLEAEVAKLKQTDITIQDQIDNLDGDVTDLEDRVTVLENEILEPPPDVEEPPPDVEEPPPDVEEPPPTHTPGQPDVIADGKTLQELVAAGGTVTLPTGKFYALAVISQPTEIIGSNTVLTAEGLNEIEGKAMLEASTNLTLRGLSLSDSSVPDGNGAAVRPAPGVTLEMYDCEVSNCQNGIMTSNNTNNTIIDNCYFHDNGAGDGRTHELYISGNLTLTNSVITSGALSTHAVKTRAASTIIKDCTIRGNTSGDWNIAGSVIDISDSGDALIEDSVIESAPGSTINDIIAYGYESATYGVKTMILRNVTITDGSGSGGCIATNQPTARLQLENCTYTADNPPTFRGWANVEGAFTKAPEYRES